MFARFFLPARQFECHHGIARTFVKLGELRRRIRARFGLADACLDLSPICHSAAL
jgi:hypothetical protein